MTQEEKAKAYDEALKKARFYHGNCPSEPESKKLEGMFPVLRESEDERIRKALYEFISDTVGDEFDGYDFNKREALAYLEKQKEPHYTKRNALFDKCVENCDPEVMKKVSDEVDEMLEKEKQKEPKPIIQDVELNDAVYDYVRDHFIAGADFTPEYIKKLMENAFFAGVDYYLLKQESESCESDTNVEKVIEDVIRVYGKTQGEWVGGYDVDTLIVNLRRAFNKKEQKPAEWSDYKDKVNVPYCSSEPEWSEEDENARQNLIAHFEGKILKLSGEAKKEAVDWLKSLRPSWKPSEEQMEALERASTNKYLSAEQYDILVSLYENLKKL